MYEQQAGWLPDKVEYPYEGDSQKVRFHFGNGITNVQFFTYFTGIPKSIVDAAVADGSSYTLTNTIVHTGTESGDSADFTVGTKAVDPSEDTVIEKGYNNQGGGDASLVQSQYIIRINEGAKDFVSGDWLDITDIFEVIGYAPSHMDSNNKYVTEDMIYQSGLLDAVFNPDEIYVVDLNDLDANGEPKEVAFSYTTESKTETTVIKNYLFNDNSTDYWTEWYAECEPGDVISLTISGSDLSKLKCSEVKFDFTDENKNHGSDTKSLQDYINSEYVVPDASGEYTFNLTIPNSSNNVNIKRIYISGNGTFLRTVCPVAISGVQKETTTKNYLHIQVPDEKYLQITYAYNLKTNANTPANVNGDKPAVGSRPPVGSKAQFKNEASMETSDGTATDDAGNNEFRVERSSGGVTTNSPPSIKKVNIGNETIDNIYATFKLARWTGTQWEYACSLTPADPDENTGDEIGYNSLYQASNGTVPTGAVDLVIEGSHPLNLESNVLYKIVETSNEDGYVECPYVAGITDVESDEMKDFVFYFVYSGDTSEYQSVVGDGRKIYPVASQSTLAVPNAELIDVSVTKSWTPQPDSTMQSTFTLYYTTEQPSGGKLPASNKLSLASEIDSSITTKTLYSNTNGTAVWTDIPNGYQGKPIYYYVIESSYTVGAKEYFRQNDGTYQTRGDNPETGPYQGIYTNNGLNRDGTVTCTNTKGLSVRKTWKNADNTVMATPPIESITFTLQGKQTAEGAWSWPWPLR